MKYAFSTLGCPDWTWQEITTTAKDLGYDGIEIRGIGNEICAPKAAIFNRENIDKTVDDLYKLDMVISCLTSGALLYEKDKNEHQMAMIEAKNHIDLASKLQVPFVRVLGDKHPEASEYIDDEYVFKSLDYLSAYASGNYVTLLIETNGVFADSNRLYKLVKKLDRENVAVLWDVHHPYRYFNESVSDTYNTLKDYIKYVHVKDSVMENGKVKYKMVGHGDVPVAETIKLLKDSSYDGYVSLEWVKRWNMELEAPGIVFSNFINYVKSL